MIKYYLFFAAVIALYGGLYWFSTRGKAKHAKVSFVLASFVVFSSLVVFMFTNLFFSLFGVVLIGYVAIYIGSRSNFENRLVIKNGVFGGIWLAIPLYVYLVSNS